MIHSYKNMLWYFQYFIISTILTDFYSENSTIVLMYWWISSSITKLNDYLKDIITSYDSSISEISGENVLFKDNV